MMIRHLLLDSIERYPDDGIVPIFVMLKDYDVNSESLFDYLLDYRIEKSLPLLLERQASITSVAEQTGFSSPAYFSKIFRQQMGCSPSEYRNRADHT